jgi:hypothetical protein
MEDLDLEKLSNTELQTLKKELENDFFRVKEDVVKVYDHWKAIEVDYYIVDKLLKTRGIR